MRSPHSPCGDLRVHLREPNRCRSERRWSYPPYLERALEKTRARQLELSRKNRLVPSGQEQLATVDLMLATVYRTHPKREDVARPLLHESIALWEACIAKGADPDKSRAQQLQALQLLGLIGYSIMGEALIRRWNKATSLVYHQCRGCAARHRAALRALVS